MSSMEFDIIMLALPRWDGQYSSTSYSMAKALSMHGRVFYIDNPFTYKDYFSGRNKEQISKRKSALRNGKNIFIIPDAKYPNLVAVTPKLTWPINWLPPGVIYNTISKVNDAIVEECINQTIDTYNIKKYLFINSFNPLYGRFFSKRLKPYKTIYHSVDDISKSAYVSKHGTRLENEAVKNADVTLVTSMELKRLKSHHSANVIYLPNAADVALFNRAVEEDLPIPAEIKKISPDKKIICYTGNICHRLDYELLVKIANNYKDAVLLMIGPIANDNYKKAGLDTLTNVVFTGKKSLEELPAYLKYVHCCIIPFLCIPLTKSIYPLKINEYLSAGKPVVTTNFSEDIANFSDIALVSNDHDEFLQNIDKSLLMNSVDDIQQRVKYAAGNNWQARAEQFLEIVK
ncbi:MAG TPA: glycosyltransferase [Cyclobacteriaceae bacterium]|nr:glycosyltransferase [Cyclobacteriaceae bacterium]